MKKFLTLAAGVVAMGAFTASAFAQVAGPQGQGVQTPPPVGQKHGGQKGAHAPIGRKLLKELNLTPDQIKQVKELMEKFQAANAPTGTTPPVGTTPPRVGKAGKGNRKEAMAKRTQFL